MRNGRRSSRCDGRSGITGPSRVSQAIPRTLQVLGALGRGLLRRLALVLVGAPLGGTVLAARLTVLRLRHDDSSCLAECCLPAQYRTARGRWPPDLGRSGDGEITCGDDVAPYRGPTAGSAAPADRGRWP